MDLLKDIKDGKYNLELLFVIIVLFLYFYCKKSNTKPTVEPTIEPTIEPMSGGDVVSNELKTAIIKEIKSQIGIDSIKKLSLIAERLQNGEDIVLLPSNINVDKLNVGSLSSLDKESKIILGSTANGNQIYIKNIEPPNININSSPSFNVQTENNGTYNNLLKIDNSWSIETTATGIDFKNNNVTQFTIEKNSDLSSVNDIKAKIDLKASPDHTHNYAKKCHQHNFDDRHTQYSGKGPESTSVTF